MTFPPKGWTAEVKSARVTFSPTRTNAEVSLVSEAANSSSRGSSKAISSARPNRAPIEPPIAAPASAPPGPSGIPSRPPVTAPRPAPTPTAESSCAHVLWTLMNPRLLRDTTAALTDLNRDAVADLQMGKRRSSGPAGRRPAIPLWRTGVR
jgi:hypothetical protein